MRKHKRESGTSRSGPATVEGSRGSMMSLGNREGDPTAMILSQENYLSWNHRLTCERWGGDWAV